MEITEKEVAYVADLARLNFSEQETEEFTNKLDEILMYIHMLDGLNTDDVAPTCYISNMYNVMREDKTQPSLKIEKVLENACEVENQQFQVPSILE